MISVDRIVVMVYRIWRGCGGGGAGGVRVRDRSIKFNISVDLMVQDLERLGEGDLGYETVLWELCFGDFLVLLLRGLH